MMAAVLAKGTTVIENAACEPDIVTLANFLVKMGAHIDGIGTKRLEIEGVDSLSPVEDTMIPDRIEAGTFIIACGITGGEITVENVKPEHLRAVMEKSIDAGLNIIERETSLQIKSDDRPSPVSIRTAPYPGFPTDLQAQWMAWMSLANGHSTILETVYPDRFTHLAELRRMGADIILQGNTAFVRGREKLQAAPVMSTDIRASACLVLAGLAAEGRTTISRVYHIDRGFQHIEEKLQSLGADIRREEDTKEE
jgi:UDP-N-acetylglucosamine 1-carboxyvinyltransferase